MVKYIAVIEKSFNERTSETLGPCCLEALRFGYSYNQKASTESLLGFAKFNVSRCLDMLPTTNGEKIWAPIVVNYV